MFSLPVIYPSSSIPTNQKILIPIQMEEEDQHSDLPLPLSLSNDGEFYDRDYHLVRPEEKPNVDIPPLPEPNMFASYSEYEHNLLLWYENSTKILSMNDIRLPHLMGLHFNRPFSVGEEEIAKKFSARKNKEEKPDVENTYKRENSFKAFKRDHVGTKLFDTESSWESVFVPPEPDPNNFATYEEYKSALSRWAVLCSKTLLIPPHASMISDELLQFACDNNGVEQKGGKLTYIKAKR